MIIDRKLMSTSIKTYVLGALLDFPEELILMSTHTKGFYGGIRNLCKIKYAPILFNWCAN